MGWERKNQRQRTIGEGEDAKMRKKVGGAKSLAGHLELTLFGTRTFKVWTAAFLRPGVFYFLFASAYNYHIVLCLSHGRLPKRHIKVYICAAAARKRNIMMSLPSPERAFPSARL